MQHVVVIGGGQAGSSLVAKLRNSGFDGKITLFAEENVPPYQRPPLSKAYLLGDMSVERLYLRPESFYAANDITLRLNVRVTAINAAAKTVSVGDEIFPYDELVLTTGSTPRRLPKAVGGDLEGVYCVRTLQDANAMEPEFQNGARVLIIGGGYIGLEAAAVAAKKGLKVTLVEMADRILKRVASPETSNYFSELHASHGVDLREGIGLETLVGDTRVRSAKLTDGSEIDVDFVIVGVGILPGSDLAETAGLTIENGIKTDCKGRTSDAHIWSAGDCASFPYQGAQIRLESVGNAIDQAEVVAKNIMGADVDYVVKPWFWSDQYDCKLQIAGLSNGYDTVITRKGAGTAVSYWYYKENVLIALDAMSDPRGYMVGKRLIEAGKSPSQDAIADPETDLMALLKA